MKVDLINDNIYHLISNNQYELASTFIRMEEFYESPFADINGKWFSLDFYMDRYAEANDGKFSYFTDWTGFNIPGNSLLEFFDKFDSDLRTKEKNVRQFIERHILDNDANFYIIGSIDGDSGILNHEYAHANYYLNDNYRIACEKIWQKMPVLTQIHMTDALIAKGYTFSKVEDETQAYLSTATISELFNVLKFDEFNLPIKSIKEYQDNFETIIPIKQVELYK
jgi:hypothetical protein